MHISKLFFIVGLITLSGCATTDPVLKVVTQRVEVPIPIACKEEAPVLPSYCFVNLSETSDIYDKTKCLLSDRAKSIGYEAELLSKFNACK